MTLKIEPITNKELMYKHLAAGGFGNTIPQYFSVQEWLSSGEPNKYEMWGVRSMLPGGPCRLFCPREEIATTCDDYQSRGHKICISVMIDLILNVTLWADIFDDIGTGEPGSGGLKVYGVEYPPKGWSWREKMPTEGKTWTGLAARSILQKHLNPSSLSDLWATFDLWPNHVVELSACDRSFGTIPGRNAVVWEVRQY